MNFRIYFLVACLVVLVAVDGANGQGFLKSIFGKSKSSSTASSKLRGALTTNSKERQGEDGFGSAEGAAYDDDDFPPPQSEQEASSPGIFRRMTSGISNFFGRFVPFSRNSRRRPGLFGRGKDQEDSDGPAEFFADFPTAADGPQIRNSFADGTAPASAGDRKRRRQQRRGNGQKRRRTQQKRRQQRPRYEQEADDYADEVDDYGTGPQGQAASRPNSNYGQKPQQSDAASDDYSAPAYPGDETNSNRQPESGVSGAGAGGFNDPYLSAPEESGSQQQPQDFDQQRFGVAPGGAAGGFSPDTAFGSLQDDNGSPFFGAGATGSTNGNRGATSGAGAAAAGSSSHVASTASGQGAASRGKKATRKQGTASPAASAADSVDVNFPADVEKDFATYGDKDETFFEQK